MNRHGYKDKKSVYSARSKYGAVKTDGDRAIAECKNILKGKRISK
jgi:hypothetical protein